jgi:hypothetical protein
VIRTRTDSRKVGAIDPRKFENACTLRYSVEPRDPPGVEFAISLAIVGQPDRVLLSSEWNIVDIQETHLDPVVVFRSR